MGAAVMSEAHAAHERPVLVLASASPRRLDLLAQIGVTPDRVQPADIDETPKPRELARPLAERLACEKCAAIVAPGQFTLAADTVVAVGRRLLPKTEEAHEARACLELMSGRSHRVLTGVAVSGPDGRIVSRVVETRVRCKRLSEAEIEAYLQSGEWRGKAGGYGIQGRAAVFIAGMIGSYTGVVGLPLHETAGMLAGLGYPILSTLANA